MRFARLKGADASVAVPPAQVSGIFDRRLTSNPLLVPRDRPKSFVRIDDVEIRWWIWVRVAY